MCGFEIERPFKGPARILEEGWDSFEKNPNCTVFSNTFALGRLAIFGKKILQDTYLEMALNFFQLTQVDMRRLRFSLEVYSKFQRILNQVFSNTSKQELGKSF